MLLSRIRTCPQKFQKRDTPYSVATVEAIVKEGIKLAKFDPLPLVDQNDGTFVVGGDGHSRAEAISRLHRAMKLPAQWRAGDDYEIPHKLVDLDEAMKLAWTANMAKKSFEAVEEAKVFAEMLASGMDMERVANECHVSTSYVKDALPLNCLCLAIRERVGKNPDAAGIEPFVAKAMAGRFARYKIGVQQQGELWHKVLKNADLTKDFVVKLLDRIGNDLAAKESTGMLFEIPASVTQVMALMKGRADNQRRIERGLAWLLQVMEAAPDVLNELCPEISAILTTKGAGMLRSVKAQAAADAELVGKCITGG
jgi:hypothetical protein